MKSKTIELVISPTSEQSITSFVFCDQGKDYLNLKNDYYEHYASFCERNGGSIVETPNRKIYFLSATEPIRLRGRTAEVVYVFGKDQIKDYEEFKRTILAPIVYNRGKIVEL